jgi:N-acetylglucosamine malate deacetylase 1
MTFSVAPATISEDNGSEDQLTKTIVSIHAHPDDAEIMAGGTLARLRALGHRLTIVTMTPGDCGSQELNPEQTAEVRRAEAFRAAAHIGAAYRCAEFRDLAIFNDDPSRRRVAGILRELRPDIVLTASPVDYLCDHEVTSQLVRDACFGAPAPNYRAIPDGEAPALPAIPHLYFMDSMGGVDRDNRLIAADFFVDVGATFEIKKEMLSEHRSQREWLLAQHGMDDYIGHMEQQTRAQGRRAGVEFAEGFRRYKGHPYPDTPLLEELLGDVIHCV